MSVADLAKVVTINHTMNETRLEPLRNRYIHLTKEQLPATAKAQGWSLRFDHCFMRVLLDHLFKDSWYNHLSRREAAYKQLSAEQLHQAIAMGEDLLERGEDYLRELNANSLRWRDKL